MPTSEFIVEGQEPTPLSPVDNENSTFKSPERRNSREITLPLPPSSNLPGAQSQPLPPPHVPTASFITPISSEAGDVSSITQSLEESSLRPPTPLAELSAEEVHHTVPTSDEETTKSDSAGDYTGSLLSPDGGANEGHEVLTGEQPVSAKGVEEKKKHQQEKSHDPAVLYSIPITPSAAAYEAAENNPNEGYFKPEFPEGAITPTPEETTA